MTDLPPLSTTRLGLRRVRAADAGPLNALCNDWEVVRWLTSVPWPNPLVETQRWIASDPAAYVVEDDAGPVGVIGLEGELGYWFGRPHWGRGYASEAVGPVINAAFEHLGWGDLPSGYIEGNRKSARILHDHGFAKADLRPVFCKARKEQVAVQKVTLSARDWRAARDWRVETPRLIIAPHRAQDLELHAAMVGAPDVARMLSTAPLGASVADIAKRTRGRRYRNRPGFSAAIRLKGSPAKDGPMVGEIGLSGAEIPELGYWIGQDHWRRGFAQEALAAFVSDMFDRFDLAQIRAECFLDNPASLHVLQRSGFQITGQAMGVSLARDDEAPVAQLRLTAARLRAMRRA